MSTLRRSGAVLLLGVLPLAWLAVPPPAHAAGTVTVAVVGQGSVTGDGISCSAAGGDCSQFYADEQERIIDLPLRSFAPIGVTSSEQPPLDRVESLLFVVDTLNFLPGASGSMVLSEIAFVR